MEKRTCSIDGCSGLAHARHWCPGHYRRWLRHGDPLGGRKNYALDEGYRVRASAPGFSPVVKARA